MNRLSPTPVAPLRPTPSRASARHRLALVALVAIVAVGAGCRERNGIDGAAAAASIPTAGLDFDRSEIAAGDSIQFLNASTGDIDTYAWAFSDGQTSADPNPIITFPDAGTYDVELTVSGPRGSSRAEVIGEIVVAADPVAGFSCAAAVGFAPLTVSCTSTATDAVATSWTVTNETTLEVFTPLVPDAPDPSFALTAEGDVWTVRQEVTNAFGRSDVLSQAGDFRVAAMELRVTPASGTPGPGTVTLTADTRADASIFGTLAGTFGTWTVDGLPVGNVILSGDEFDAALVYDFTAPGTYEIGLDALGFGVGSSQTFQYVVAYVAPTADFQAGVDAGPGPLTVVFDDRSIGGIDRFDWDFGDGVTCVWPAPPGAPPGSPSVCDAANPSHTYTAPGRYDVRLTVTGPAAVDTDPDVVDVTLQAGAVTVTILDPSFEAQTVGAEIAEGWTALRPDGAAQSAEHVALSQTETEGADAGMPTEGDQWAALDGLGTDGSDPALTVQNGIEAKFFLPAARPVLEFDYVLLFAEPPAGIVRDAITATVTGPDDANPALDKVVEITSAAADAWSAYDGGSTRYPTLDGGTTRVTPIRVASLDVAAAFPAADADTEFTLTIRLANDANAFRPPRAYVDDVRFVARAAFPIAAEFMTPADTIVTGQPIDFTNTTCPDPSGGTCETPTSWRWDFDTRESIMPPESTGSALRDPTYVFDEPGDYAVTLWARNAEQADEAVMNVTVLEAPESIPVVESVVPNGAEWDIDVRSDSTSDATDPIVSWSWDFQGYQTPTDEDPAPQTAPGSGTFTVRLTVTTAEGFQSTNSVEVDLE